MKETYPAIETKLTDMLQRIAEADKEVARINGSAPDGVPLRLREVELAARDFEGFTTAAPPIAQELKLPHWEQPSTLAWPPPRSFDPTSFTPVPFDRSYSPEWWRVKEEEARALRERQEREAAEREAKARADWHGPRWWEGERA